MKRSTAMFLGAVGVVLVAIASVATGNPVAVIAISIALAGIGAIVLRPWLGIAILVVILPANGVVSALLATADQATTSLIVGGVKDVLLLTLFVSAIATGRIRRVRPEITILVGVILALGGVAAFWSPSVAQAAYGWRNDYEPLLLILVAAAILDSGTAQRVARIVAVVAQVSAVVTLVTWGLGLRWLHILSRLPVEEGERFPSSLFTAGSVLPRGFSPFSAPNEMAVGVLAMLAILWGASGLRLRTRLLLSVLPLAAIAVSQSRSGYLGVAILALLLFTIWVHGRRPRAAMTFLIVAGSLVVAAATAYIVYQLNEGGEPSIGGHAASLGEAVELMVQHPFGLGLGEVGPRSARFEGNSTTVESFWLLLALEAGPLVLLVFVALLARVAWIGFFSKSRLATTATLAVGASIVSQLVLPTLQDLPASMLLWLAVGMGLVGSREAEEQRRRAKQAAESDQVHTVSVVIPTVGRPSLRVAVESVLAQTVPVAQVIVAADTVDPLDLPDDPRIVVERVGPRAGGNTARQRGIETATSTLIAMLDDDDVWESTRLERQLEAVASTDVPDGRWIATCRVTMVGATGATSLYPIHPIDGHDLMQYLFWKRHPFASHGFVQASTLLFPRELALEVPFRIGLRFHQDIDWLTAVSRKYPDITVVQPWEPLVKYIAGAGTVSRTIVGKASAEWAVENLSWHSPRTVGDFILTQSLGFSRRTGSIAEMKEVIAMASAAGRPGISARVYSRLILIVTAARDRRRPTADQPSSSSAKSDDAPTSTR